MALVLLPCDLPSWPAVQRHLNQIKNAQNSSQLLDGMQKLHAICCISLDPDENDKSDPQIFLRLQNFLDSVLNDEERQNFFHIILPSLVAYALRLKQHKPYDGLHYSLQQQAECTEMERRFVASLIANAFFSTFPRRTMKTHPTLQDCNFSKSFVHLDSHFQQKKLRTVFQYFQKIAQDEPKGKIVIVRQIMCKKSLLVLEDWLSCDKPLCPVIIRHNGKIEQAELGTYQICFSSDRIGGAVLEGGEEQEDVMFCAFPELYVALMFTETLENNEALTAHGLQSMIHSKASSMNDQRNILNSHVCFIDATDFHKDLHFQYRENDIVREANKAFVGFHQRHPHVRLPPIGKSCSSTPPENRSFLEETASKSAWKLGDSESLSYDAGEVDPLSLKVMKNLMGKKGGLSSLVNKILERPVTDSPSADIAPPDPASRTNLEKSGKTTDDNPRRCGDKHREVLRAVPELPEKNWELGEGEMAERGDGPRIDLPSESGSATPTLPDLVARSPSRKCAGKQFGRSIDREDSEDSVYGDCQDHLEEDCFDPIGLSVRRPLTMAGHRTSEVERPKIVPRAAEGRLLQVPKASALDGAGMEASFISCSSHLSSSSSSDGSSEDEAPDGADDEQGFASCVEDMDDDFEDKIPAGVLVRARRKLYEIPELPLDFESPWGRRALANTLKGRMRDSCGSDLETDDESNFAMDIHIAGPDVVDPEVFVLRRSASTGFILDEDEDLFLGDGLEHEREWLAQFRHRSTNPSRSLSRRNSSRYSFSSDFSSDLEDIYEHFEEKMTEGPVRENPAYSARLGGRSMKRTLSDSLASFPRTATGLPRSLSLTEKMQEEKMNMEYAKQGVLHRTQNATDLQGMLPRTSSDFASIDGGENPSKLMPQLVGTSVEIEQNWSEIEECVTLPFPMSCRNRNLARLPSQMSVWWNYNSVYDFYVPLRRKAEPDDDSGERFSRLFSKLDLMAEASSGSGEDATDRIPSLIVTDDADGRIGAGGPDVVEISRSFSVRRSKSSTDARAILRGRPVRGRENFLHVGGIARCISSEDVRVRDGDLGGSRDRDKTKDAAKPSLKKWQVASNLDRLEREQSSTPSKESDRSFFSIDEAKGFAIKEIFSEFVADSGAKVPKHVDDLKHVRSGSQNVRPTYESQQTNDQFLDLALDPDGIKPVATGNWGCEGKGGDPQLKALIQWMAASRANVPFMIYYTGGDQRVVKLNIVCRVLLDRHWSVSHVLRAILRHYSSRMEKTDPDVSETDLLDSLLPKETDL